MLNDKRYSNNFSQSNMGSPRVLPNLGVTIAKMPKNGFQIISVEKVESRFVPSDFITELSISLDQMSLEDAARLLELLVPYRIQLEVLRSSEEEEPPKVEKTSAEIHKEGPNESPEATNEVEGTDMPRLPSGSIFLTRKGRWFSLSTSISIACRQPITISASSSPQFR